LHVGGDGLEKIVLGGKCAETEGAGKEKGRKETEDRGGGGQALRSRLCTLDPMGERRTREYRRKKKKMGKKGNVTRGGKEKGYTGK